jgi:hypothetical protein
MPKATKAPLDPVEAIDNVIAEIAKADAIILEALDRHEEAVGNFELYATARHGDAAFLRFAHRALHKPSAR